MRSGMLQGMLSLDWGVKVHFWLCRALMLLKGVQGNGPAPYNRSKGRLVALLTHKHLIQAASFPA